LPVPLASLGAGGQDDDQKRPDDPRLEELVLSFVPAAGTKRIRWDRKKIDSTLRAGLDQAAHEVAGKRHRR